MADSGSHNKEPEQQALFEMPPAWADHWRDMPSYDHNDLQPKRSLIVHFKGQEEFRAFQNVIGQRLGPNQKATWYPEPEIGRFRDKRFEADNPLNPEYPVYIISKGRWESRRTAKALDRSGVPYRIVVEPHEFDKYAAVIHPEKILALPFSNLGQGSVPARNWVWDHAQQSGAERHWILDDNISEFFRFQNNLKTPVSDGTIFRVAEQFVDRYENVALAGFNYFMFVTRKSGAIPPYTLNTRIYSCILIKNDIPFRWRGRYNEDTDLSLRVLKSGLCTVLFNAFLADKEQTMLMKGGNTDELYQGDGRLRMAQSLKDQHPDIVKVTQKWGRPQHHVNYKIFARNKLRLREDVELGGTNDYGMSLKILDGEVA